MAGLLEEIFTLLLAKSSLIILYSPEREISEIRSTAAEKSAVLTSIVVVKSGGITRL